MKKFKIILILMFVNTFLYSQDFKILYSTPLGDRLFNATQLNSFGDYNLYLYLDNDSLISNPNYLLQISNQEIQPITDTLSAKIIDKQNQVYFNHEVNDTAIWVGIVYNNTKVNIVISTRYNSQNNIYYAGDTTISEYLFNYVFNSENNIVIAGMEHSPISGNFFIRKFDLKGNMLGEANESISLPSVLFETLNGDYIVLNNTDKIYKFNSNLTSDSVYSMSYNSAVSSPPKFSSGHLKIGNSILLNATKDYWQGTVIQNDDSKSAGLYKYANNQIITLFEDTTLTETSYNVHSASYSIDAIDSNYIYFGFIDGNCPYFFSQHSSCVNEVLIYCTDINGNLKWSKKLGGDAKYWIYKILATEDKGCLVIVGRYHPNDQTNDNEDLYYVKLDKDGNIQEDYFSYITSVNKIVIEKDYLVYPNPSETFISFKGLEKNKVNFIDVYNSIGQFIITQKLCLGRIDISNLSEGVFFFKIRNNDNVVIDEGRFIKK